MEKLHVGLEEASGIIGVTRQTLVKLCKRNKVPHMTKHGGGGKKKYSFSVRALKEWLSKNAKSSIRGFIDFPKSMKVFPKSDKYIANIKENRV